MKTGWSPKELPRMLVRGFKNRETSMQLTCSERKKVWAAPRGRLIIKRPGPGFYRSQHPGHAPNLQEMRSPVDIVLSVARVKHKTTNIPE